MNRHSLNQPRSTQVLIAVMGALAFLVVGASSARAAAQLEIGSLSDSTVEPGGTYVDVVELANVGDELTDGSAIELVADLPPGLTAVSGERFGGPGTVSCTAADGVSPVLGASSVRCIIEHQFSPFGSGRTQLTGLTIKADAGASGLLTPRFKASGGGAIGATGADPISVTAALPGFGIEAFDTSILGPDGESYTQAGGHPDEIRTQIAFNRVNKSAPHGDYSPVADVHDVVVELPPGVVGNPSVLGECEMEDLIGAGSLDPISFCASESQVGRVTIGVPLGEEVRMPPAPLYNLKPPPGVAARFGFNVIGVIVVLDARLTQDGDYRLSVASKGVSQALKVNSVESFFWGQPGASTHDLERACPGQSQPRMQGVHCEGAPGAAFLRMPTSCSQEMSLGLASDSWEERGAVDKQGSPDLEDEAWKSANLTVHHPPGYPLPPNEWGKPVGVEGCDRVPVKGELTAVPTATAATTSTGLQVEVEVPNEGLENPESIASSDIKAVRVALPAGMTINPSQAEGLGVCRPGQYESTELSFAPDPAKGCPSDSKIGTVLVRTPLLEEEIPGDVYVAAPYDNPFGSLLALYVVLEEPQRGVLLKLAGEVETDPLTGQITTVFEDLPQLPFSDLEFKFREGARAPLVTPAACGTYTTHAEFTPWSNPSQTLASDSSFQISQGIGGGPCPSGGLPPFQPGLIAGTLNNNAGSYSPFNVRLFRTDAEQEFTNFSVKLPPGLLAKIAGLGYCSDGAIAAARARSGAEEIANPSCPASSQVGRTLAGAGVGSVLAYAPGKLYFAGPYHGSAISLVSVTAAKVGPFDLGTVVVRFALRVNPETGEVFIDAANSDRIPHIIQGVAVHLRDIRAYVDRPEFVLNPTNCSRTSIASTVLGSGLDFSSAADDAPVTVSTPFQAVNCAALPFRPKLSLTLRGRTKRGGNPALRAVYTARAGDANLSRVQVSLPHSAFLDQSHIRTICTRVQFKLGDHPGERCPAASIYGYAKAITPLLDEPLQGPVFLRSSDHPLPDLVAALHSGPIDITVVGRIDSVGKVGRIRNTFEAVPDAPVTKFTLKMRGGGKGLLVNSANLCSHRNRARVQFAGQNGKTRKATPVVRPRCGRRPNKSPRPKRQAPAG
jgi:hypothetical protein